MKPRGAKHPVAQLDETVHQRSRLGILAVLSEVGEADFKHLRDTLGLTDGNLGQHLNLLTSASLVQTRRTFEGSRPRTWIAITPAGRAGLANEILLLEAILGSTRSS